MACYKSCVSSSRPCLVSSFVFLSSQEHKAVLAVTAIACHHLTARLKNCAPCYDFTSIFKGECSWILGCPGLPSLWSDWSPSSQFSGKASWWSEQAFFRSRCVTTAYCPLASERHQMRPGGCYQCTFQLWMRGCYQCCFCCWFLCVRAGWAGHLAWGGVWARGAEMVESKGS